MKTIAFILAVLVAPSVYAQQQEPSDVAAILRQAAAQVENMQVAPTPPERLLDALNVGGAIYLVPGATYPTGIVVRVSGTVIHYNGAVSHPTFGPALEILPGVSKVTIFDFNGTTDDKQRAILCGHNDATQTTLDLVPRDIKLIRPTVLDYGGKRGIEVNCAGEIDTPVISMTGKLGQDTQGIGVANTPGPLWVHGAQITGGVESFMVGGDTMKIPAVPSDITMEDFSLYHPLDWRGQGYGIKDLLELKACVRCIFRRGILDGSWKDAQPGYAIVVTPRNGSYIQDVLFEDLTIRNAAGVFNILGLTDVLPPTPYATSKLVARRIKATVSEELGRVPGSPTPSSMGVFAQIEGSTVDFALADSVFLGDGSYFIGVYKGSVVQADGSKVPSGPMQTLTVTNSAFPALKYSFMLFGTPNAAPTQTGVVTLTVTGNTITGANSVLKKSLPNNTYVN